MRISDRLIPVALLGVGVGSAFAFDGSGGRDGMSPAVSVDVVPRSALSAPAVAVPTVAVPTVVVPNAPMSGTLRGPELKHALTPVEAFRSGAQALRAGDAETGLRALEFAAENGHAIAQWKLGRMYADGDQVGRDDVRAFEYFRSIVDSHADDSLGTPQARFVANAFVALGGYYISGIPNSAVTASPSRARSVRLCGILFRRRRRPVPARPHADRGAGRPEGRLAGRTLAQAGGRQGAIPGSGPVGHHAVQWPSADAPGPARLDVSQ